MRRLRMVAVAGCLLLAACAQGSPAKPSPNDIQGTWTGTGTYPNVPFTLTLYYTGPILRGEYRDQHDHSLSVNGTFVAPAFALIVDFGDAKLNLTGTIIDGRTALGEMFTSALGNRKYLFTMTR